MLQEIQCLRFSLIPNLPKFTRIVSCYNNASFSSFHLPSHAYPTFEVLFPLGFFLHCSLFSFSSLPLTWLPGESFNKNFAFCKSNLALFLVIPLYIHACNCLALKSLFFWSLTPSAVISWHFPRNIKFPEFSGGEAVDLSSTKGLK